jgi:hypothetical protein
LHVHALGLLAQRHRCLPLCTDDREYVQMQRTCLAVLACQRFLRAQGRSFKDYWEELGGLVEDAPPTLIVPEFVI